MFRPLLVAGLLLIGVISTSGNSEVPSAHLHAVKEREGHEHAADQPCPTSWSLVIHGSGNDPYCYYSPPSQVLGWDAARNTCLALGGDLVSFETISEYKSIITFLNGNSSTSVLYLTWSGLRWMPYLGLIIYDWVYSDGHDYTDSYMPWVGGRTPNPDGFSNCTGLKTVGNKTGLQPLPCHYQQPFLCKQDAGFCNGGNFSSSTHKGTIKSPNYPNNYFNNLDCIYTIHGGAGNTVFLSFSVYKVQALFDSVTIYDGPSINARVIYKIIVGSSKLEYESTGPDMTVRFRTDNTVTDQGWSADWQANPIYINDTNAGTLASPNYPSNYPNSVDQVYYVVAPDPFKINVTITDFNTEDGHDFLYVFDAPTADFTTPPRFNLSGRLTVPYSFVTNTSTLSLRFQSDILFNYKGWSLNWLVV